MDSARVKTGLLALSLLSVSLLLIPTSHNRAPVLGEQYSLVFHEVQGLMIGCTVTVGGVEAGRVVNIDFAPRGSWKELNKDGGERPVVLVKVGLDPGFHLPPLSGYRIDANLKGLREVNIIPASGDQRITAGSIVNAELDAEQVDRISKTIYDFEDLFVQTQDVRREFTGPKFQRGLKDSVSNFRFYSRELLARSKGAGAPLHDVEQELNREQAAMLDQVDRVDAQLSRVRESMGPDYVAKARQGTQAMKTQLASLDRGLDGMVSQGQDFTERFRGYLRSFDASPLGPKRARAMAAQAHALAEQMDDYAALSHDFHGLTSDPQVQKDLHGKFKDLKGRSESLKRAAAALEALAHTLQSFGLTAPEATPTP